MGMQQWCKWRYVRLLLLQFALVPAIASAAPMSPIGTCEVVSSTASSVPAFPCQVAAFGEYFHLDAPQYRVAVAWDDTQLACDPLEEEGDERVYHDAIVVVRRGQCSFQGKWRHVARAGGLVMLLVNSEDTLLQLSGVAYDGSSNTKALSIARADGESLLELLNAHSQQRDDDPMRLSITLPMSRLEQAAARTQYLLQTNVPLIAYEYFMDELAAPSSPMFLRDFDALLSALTPNTARPTWITKGDDLRCLHQAATGQLPDEDGHTVSNEPLHCCRHRQAPSRPNGEDESQAQRRLRYGHAFHSPFVKELFEAMNVMGVFLDELGAFNESLKFFQQAAQLCPHDATLQSTRVRVAAEEGGALNTHPERAAYLQYTITPATMFIGCQGIDVLPIQQAIHALRTAVYPNLQSQPFTWDGENSVESPPSQEATRRRRIAFLSTWFRNHSVGKLLLGVIERLDRTKFHIQIYRCVHFLRFPDKLTDAFRRVADTFTELPVDMDEALALLRKERIDVLIYPKLGMDEWTLLLAHHRIAPIQCVFWGHPITTGNPVIDYFISSEYFVSDFFDSDDNRKGDIIDKDVDERDSAETFIHHGTHFSEQVVLFRGLGTFFTRFA